VHADQPVRSRSLDADLVLLAEGVGRHQGVPLLTQALQFLLAQVDELLSQIIGDSIRIRSRVWGLPARRPDGFPWAERGGQVCRCPGRFTASGSG
jgi:hypothetical protein